MLSIFGDVIIRILSGQWLTRKSVKSVKSQFSLLCTNTEVLNLGFS